MNIVKRAFLTVIALQIAVFSVYAHVKDHPSVHDTVAGVIKRFRTELDITQLNALDEAKVVSILTEEERHILSTEHVSFNVNAPVIVTVVKSSALNDSPFWLKSEGFKKLDERFEVDGEPFEAYQKQFDAGWVGLGVHAFNRREDHYFVIVNPVAENDEVTISDLYPGQLRVGNLEQGARAYADDDTEITVVPAVFKGFAYIQTLQSARDDAQLLGIYSETRHPSGTEPDQVVLTWSDDPKTTQTVQWRTSPETGKGVVSYMKKSDHNRFSPKQPLKLEAETVIYETPAIINDPVTHRHTATMRDLEPGTTYVYSIGDGTESGWTELREFTTAPDGEVPFSFIYMGDAQNGLYRWGTLVHKAFQSRPDAAFYLMAGDLVNVGNERWDWDDFFYNSSDIYDRRQLVPAIGNHENQGGHPTMYLDLFTLLNNGPDGLEPERAYSFEYSNALFVILDSNLSAAAQTEWLEETLKNSDATWKFVSYHHPAYSSAPRRDNRSIRELWGAIFDKYHVDMALQGHDHAYLRTYPMKDGKPVESPAEGTVYVVSVSGTKFYEQADREYTEFGMTNVSTYQTLDIQISGNRLVYRSYDIDGALRDELIIEK